MVLFGGAGHKKNHMEAKFERWAKNFVSEDDQLAVSSLSELQSELLNAQKSGYSGCLEKVALLESVLVALLGHTVPYVRERAVVLLNVLYDGHRLQLDEALPVTVSCVGETEELTIPLFYSEVSSPSALKLRMFSPSSEPQMPPSWSEMDVTVADGELVQATLPTFTQTGFYDWIIVPRDGSVQIEMDDERRLRGRIIVQPEGARDAVITEVPIDQVGATWDEATGKLQTRGSFDAVVERLPEIKFKGSTAVYLMGTLERPQDDPDASPFNVTDRRRVASVLGGEKAFANLVKEIRELGMVPIIDGIERVARNRAHRKYRPFMVQTVDSTGSMYTHPGTDGREVQWEQSGLLNYRDVRVWDLMIDEIKHMAHNYGVMGVRLDNAQSYPPIMALDSEEMFARDPDGEMHYSKSEIFYGMVVKANEETGYWTSDAALELNYPNPFLIKFAREMWHSYPSFYIIAECHFQREALLTSSGSIVHSVRIPQILASIGGKSMRRDGTVAGIPQNKRSTARTFARLMKNESQYLPKGALIINCTCTHLSPYPAVLFGRRAWLAVDLVNFISGIPMVVLGEETGRSYRFNMAPVIHHEEDSIYDVHYDSLLPRSPKKKKRTVEDDEEMKPKELGMKKTNSKLSLRSSSLLGLKKMGSVSNLAKSASLVFQQPQVNNTSGSSTPKKMVRNVSLSDMKGMTVRTVSSEDMRKLAQMEERTREEIGPHAGFDITQISGHYNHRAIIRQEHSVFRTGHLVNIEVAPQQEDQIFAFARITNDEVAIVVMNLRGGQDGPQYENAANVELKLSSLLPVLPERLTMRLSSLFRIYDLVTDVDVGTELFTLEELMFRGYSFQLNPLSALVFSFEPLPESESLETEHFQQALHRLQSEHEALVDPRENHLISLVSRGAAESLDAFASAVNRIRQGLENLDTHEGHTQYLFQIILQRASQLHYLVTYEGYMKPTDFEPPTGEQIVSYMSLLACAARDQYLQKLARSLVDKVKNIGPIVFVAPELGRFSTAGGLGVMVDELTKGMVSLGMEVYVISPVYTVNRKGETGYLQRDGFQWTRNIDVNLGTHVVTCGIFEGEEHGVNLIFIERGDYFPKVYADPGSQERLLQTIILMSLGSLEACCHKGLTPAVFVTNDWMPALAAGYARNGFFGSYFDNTTFFHLIHNLGDGAYEGRVYPSPQQGLFESVHRLPTHLLVDPWWSQKIVNPSRCAIICSDSWGTVSPSYLQELLQSHPLKPVLQNAKKPFGFPNGIRQADRERLLRERGAESHTEAKRLLQRKYFGFEDGDPSIPLFAFVGRITSQKGVHLILNAVDELVHHTGGKIQIMVCGPATYSDEYSAGCAHHMNDLRNRHRWCFWAAPGEFFTDGPLVNLGADFGLMPSVFEPGGIVQQEFFVGGTPVIAYRTGGLKDTVHEWNAVAREGNGFTFDHYSHGDFCYAVKRALRVFSMHNDYQELRKSAYDTTIDVAQVAWAWTSEFHRLRNAMFTRHNMLTDDMIETVQGDLDDSKSLVPGNKPVHVQYTGGGSSIAVKGSFDGWTQSWPLKVVSDNLAELWLRLPPGEYPHKFLVDGNWVVAPNAPRVEENGFENNVLRVT
mmetsp:Transcript_9844/g.30033  ORF Transcript_9844/g.30033 Transcript_9844/m.30033 type:complete len:1593 (-) Transcript_9844:1566-6344(-)